MSSKYKAIRLFDGIGMVRPGPRTLIPTMRCLFRLPEASIERLRKFLLPLELAEAELKAKPAAAAACFVAILTAP